MVDPRTSLCRAALAALCAVLLGFAAAARAQGGADPVIRFLEAIPGKQAGASYSVMPGADLTLPFAVERGGKLDLYLSPFRGDHGHTISIEPTIDGIAAGKDQRLVLSAAGGSVYQLRLKAPELLHPGKYKGTLTVLLDGKHQQTDPLELVRPALPLHAQLAVDWKAPVVHETTLGRGAGSFELQVRNPSAEWPAEGVFLRALEVTAPAGANFQPEQHLELEWNGRPVEGLWRTPSARDPARSIGPNRQVTITGRPVDLDPGEYTVKVALGAANAALDSQNPVTLKLYVKHGVALPLLVLILAILLSWIATKGLEAQRRRGTQLAKVDAVRKAGAWTRERDSLPAVAARAFLKQAEDRNRKLLDALFGQDTTGAHLANAQLLARVLERVADVRERIERAGWRPFTVHRARKCLTEIVSSIRPETINDAQASAIEVRLADLEKWFDPKQLDSLYRGALENDLQRVLEQARPEAFAPHHAIVQALADAVRQGKAPGGNVAEMERAYAILKILCERRRDQDNEALEQLFDRLKREPQIDLEHFFDAADQIAWGRLASAKLRFVEPTRKELEPRRAYELIEFRIAPENDKLGNNFLFKHRVTYVWTLERRKWRAWRTVTEQRTREPRVVQYAPQAGDYRMRVRLEYQGPPVSPEPSDTLTIGTSAEREWLNISRLADVGALGIAMLFAVVTGLATYYFGKPAFGSITDYITLFVWGAGVDQTKNFVQQLAKVSGAPATP